MIPSDVRLRHKRRHEAFLQRSKDLEAWLQGYDGHSQKEKTESDTPEFHDFTEEDDHDFIKWKKIKKKDTTVDQSVQFRERIRGNKQRRHATERQAIIDDFIVRRFNAMLKSIRCASTGYISELGQALRESAGDGELSAREYRTIAMFQDVRHTEIWRNEQHLFELWRHWSTDSAHESNRKLTCLVRLRTDEKSGETWVEVLNTEKLQLTLTVGEPYLAYGTQGLYSMRFMHTEQTCNALLSVQERGKSAHFYLTHENWHYSGDPRFLICHSTGYSTSRMWDISGELRRVYYDRCVAVLRALRAFEIASEGLLCNLFQLVLLYLS